MGVLEIPSPPSDVNVYTYCGVAGVAVAAVEISPAADTVTALGVIVQFEAVARDSSNNQIGDRVFGWTSSDLNVAAVDTMGAVVALAAGTARITATTGGVSSSAALTVSVPIAENVDVPEVVATVSQATFTIEVTAEIDSILKDDTTRFTAILRDANGNTVANARLTWSSSNPAIATVDGTGQVTGRRMGSTTIRATRGTATGGAAVRVTALEFAEVTAGVWHTCALAVNGLAYCWGANALGQLGDGSRTDRILPVPVAGGIRFQTVNSGHEDPAAHTCGPTVAGVPYCWGGNTSGRLGVESEVSAPARVQGALRFTAMSAGFRHTCGVASSNEAFCWGDNTLGALGNGTQRGSSTPVRVSGTLAFRTVSAGGFFSCGVTWGRSVHCWGTNRSGQLGNGATDQAAHSSPEPVRAAVSFRSVAAGMEHVCGVSTSGAVYCWGANGNGELGTGGRAASAVPVAVSGGLSFQMVSVGGHSCGVTTNDEAYCWGANGSGQLGDGSRVGGGDVRAVPARVSGRLRFRSVSVGTDHTCGVTTNRVAYCWGSNEHAKLGTSTTETCSGRPCSRTPIRIQGQR
jgi:alpha-tubulin suppressor-like RCC1 family protein